MILRFLYCLVCRVKESKKFLNPMVCIIYPAGTMNHANLQHNSKSNDALY